MTLSTTELCAFFGRRITKEFRGMDWRGMAWVGVDIYQCVLGATQQRGVQTTRPSDTTPCGLLFRPYCG